MTKQNHLPSRTRKKLQLNFVLFDNSIKTPTATTTNQSVAETEQTARNERDRMEPIRPKVKPICIKNMMLMRRRFIEEKL